MTHAAELAASPGRGLTASAAVAAVLVGASCAGTTTGGASAVRGGASASVEWAGLRYRVTLLPSEVDRIRARATVENTASFSRTAELPACLVRLRLYRGDRMVWDQGSEPGCGGMLRVLQLRPGERRTFYGTVQAADVLSETRPPGSYLVRAYLPGSRRPGTTRTDMELTLGEVRLAPQPADSASADSAS